MRGFAVNCEGNVTCFAFFADQLFKACVSAVGQRRRLNDGFRLVADAQQKHPDNGSASKAGASRTSFSVRINIVEGPCEGLTQTTQNFQQQFAPL
jgi:hypothetical protein